MTLTRSLSPSHHGIGLGPGPARHGNDSPDLGPARVTSAVQSPPEADSLSLGLVSGSSHLSLAMSPLQVSARGPETRTVAVQPVLVTETFKLVALGAKECNI